MVRWFTAANTKLWWSWIYVHYQSHKHFEFTKDYCLHSSRSLITDKLANGIYASLPFYGSWENHFSKVNRRGENSKWSFKGAHYTDLDSITFYSQALEIREDTLTHTDLRIQSILGITHTIFWLWNSAYSSKKNSAYNFSQA